jgi:hypothetical protein
MVPILKLTKEGEEESIRASIPPDVPPADLDDEQIERIVRAKN